MRIICCIAKSLALLWTVWLVVLPAQADELIARQDVSWAPHLYCQGTSGIVEVGPGGTMRLLIPDVWSQSLEVLKDELYAGDYVVRVYSLNGDLRRAISLPAQVKGLYEVLPDGRLVFLDNQDDQIYVINQSSTVLATKSMGHAPDGSYQNCSGVVVGDFLYISEDGLSNVLRMNLTSYDVSVFRNLDVIPSWLGSIGYAQDEFYICTSSKIYRFTETAGPTEVTDIGDNNITGFEIVWPYAYLCTNFGGNIHRVDLRFGTSLLYASGFDRPDDLGLHLPRAAFATHWSLYK